MAERPIIFSAPMVSAIRGGKKTMTRRLATSPLRKCEVGDRLWVRESLKARNLDLSGALGLAPPLTKADPTRGDLCIAYAADGEPAVEENGFNLAWVWKRKLVVPAIHMPRWVSRITLEVTSTKIERLRDISDADVSAEGIESHAMTPRGAFFALWNELHGVGAWESNPEVVAISFCRVTDG